MKSSEMLPQSRHSINQIRFSLQAKASVNTNLKTNASVALMGLVNGNQTKRHSTMNVYSHNGPICFRLTNV